MHADLVGPPGFQLDPDMRMRTEPLDHAVVRHRLPAALAPGLGNSAVLQARLPRLIAQDFAPRGYARQVLKDLEMLTEAGREHHLAMPMVAQATTLYRMLVGQGHSELDAIAVVKVLPEVTPPAA